MPDKTLSLGLETAFQQACAEGIGVISVGDEVIGKAFLSHEDAPLRLERSQIALMTRRQITADHSPDYPFFRPERSNDSDSAWRKFQEMPITSFVGLLEKMDQSYYPDSRDGGLPMYWEYYAMRDHEEGRKYVVAGTQFFARLLHSLVELSYSVRVTHENLLRRAIVRWAESTQREQDAEDVISLEEEVTRLKAQDPKWGRKLEIGFDRFSPKFRFPSPRDEHEDEDC